MYRNILTAVAAFALTVAVGGGFASPTMAQETAQSQSPQSGPTESVRNIAALLPVGGANEAVLMATDFGLLRATSDGISKILPDVPFVPLGLARKPGQGALILASGYDAEGASPVMYQSSDEGESWVKLQQAQPDSVMTSLSVSAANPNRLVGLSQSVQVSRDGGETWSAPAQPAGQPLAVLRAPSDENRLYLGTMEGLFVSPDEGADWRKIEIGDAPVTGLTALSDGRIAAFVYGKGLMAGPDNGQAMAANWTQIAHEFGSRFLRNIVVRDGTLWATADTGAILLSRDAGANWISFEGSDMATPDRIAAGKALYAENCQSCHGADGIGESPENPTAKDEFGFKAPALNDDMHAWHHSDAGLRATIREGSPRNERMAAWQDVLGDEEIDEILAYVKSTWSVNSLACQGARHMACGGHGQ